MKVAFYLDNQSHLGVDYKNPKNGNPGIGGTQYMIWTISYYLSKKYLSLNVILFAPLVERLPSDIEYYECKNIKDAIYLAKEIGIDILVIRGVEYSKEVYELIDQLNIKCIRWAHNYDKDSVLTQVYKCKNIVRNICVSREHYDSIRDHNAFKKSSYIYNALDFNLYENYIKSIEEKKNIVCYMGALEPQKGFHKLAEIWPDVVRRVPDAQLYVIGSGRLYNRKSKMGKFGISSDIYEKKFMPYLLNDRKEIDNNIHFFGELGGKEKLKVMSQAKVGIANPLGIGETFCIVAIEFQSLGVPVIARNKYGFIDTVKHNQTGLLIKRNKIDLINYICEMLTDNNKNKILGENAIEFVNETFNIDIICDQWYNLFLDVLNNERIDIEVKAKNYTNDFKWLKELNRLVFNYKLPSVLWYFEQKLILKSKIKKCLNLGEKKWEKK